MTKTSNTLVHKIVTVGHLLYVTLCAYILNPPPTCMFLYVECLWIVQLKFGGKPPNPLYIIRNTPLPQYIVHA